MSFDFAKLSAKFPGKKIHFRVGYTSEKDGQVSGVAFAYLDARDVMERLDDVCGRAGWQDEYPFRGCCRIGIKVGTVTPANSSDAVRVSTATEWIWKADGAGETDVEADKGQYSDAFKRAAVKWGIGRYLYDMPNVWFPVEKRGKSYAFSKETLKMLAERYDAWAENYFKKLEEK